MAWQVDTGYNQRSRDEAQIGRWKQVIGSTLQAQDPEAQTCELNIATKALNRKTELGRANCERTY